MEQRPRKLYIAGVDRTLNLIKRLTTTDRIPGRSTCSFELHDVADDLTLQEGMEVIITANHGEESPRLFAGEIQRFVGREEPGGLTMYSVSCADYNAILDRLLLAAAWDDTLSGDMVRDIHALKLANEGITLGLVDDGSLTSRSVFDWVPITQAMNEIEQNTGIAWNVDYYKVLNYFPPGYFEAPFTLTDNSHNYKNLHLERNKDKYRNVQVFRPGWLETSEQTENPTPKPDGSSRVFFVRFAIANKPRIFVDSVEVDPSDIGVNGLDASGTKKWYFSRQSNQLSHDSDETVLAVGTILQVIYTGLYVRIFAKENREEIDARKLIDGGSGRHEAYEDKPTIEGQDAADQYINGLIRKFGSISNIVTYQTEEHGLRAGMVQTINVPGRGIVGDFLIESVTGRANGPGMMLYNVKGFDGEVVGSWVEFFRSLVITRRSFVIRDNEYVSLIHDLTEPDLQDVCDDIDVYSANPPFQFADSDSNIVWGRWQWLD